MSISQDKRNGNLDSPIGLSEIVPIGLNEKMVLAKQIVLEKIEKNVEKLRQTYGDWLSTDDIWRILHVLQENQSCEECAGLPCRKSTNKHWIPQIQTEDNNLHTPLKPCKYFVQARKKIVLDRMFRLAEIPKQYVGLTFDDYVVDDDNEYAVKVAHSLLENLDKGTFYFGKYGTGKTMLAAIIAQEHLRRGREVLFSKVPDILRSVRATFARDSPVSEIDVVQKLYSVPILILDDVKATRQSKFASETLFDIIDARYNANLQTIMTSNDMLKEIAQALDNPLDAEKGYDGSRIYDRCKQMCIPVRLGGESRRVQKFQNRKR